MSIYDEYQIVINEAQELQQLREELQKINSVMNDIRNDYLDLFDRLRKPEDGEQK
jgi:hypothetical protein